MSEILTGLEQVEAIHAAEVDKLKGIIRGLLIVCDQTAGHINETQWPKGYCRPRDTGWYQLAEEILKGRQVTFT